MREVSIDGGKSQWIPVLGENRDDLAAARIESGIES
jgi:hypothetical protein